MAETNMNLRVRRAARAQAIVANHPDKPGICAVGPGVVEAAKRFLDANETYQKESAAWARESNEVDTAQGPLAKAYDTVRGVVMAQLPHADVGPAAVRMATPDDLLKGAEHLEAVLSTETASWVKPLADLLSPVLDASTKEWTESVLAKGTMQTAREARRVAAETFDTVLVSFRRIVRAELGRASPDYQAIRVRKGAEADTEDDTPTDGTVAPTA